MAERQHLRLLRRGVEPWNTWRRENPDVIPDLRETSLRRADLTGAKLHHSDLSLTDLREANLKTATLSGCKLAGALLGQANLSRAVLWLVDAVGADFTGAALVSAELRGANLSSAKFTGASLFLADLAEASLRGANLDKSDLVAANLTSAELFDATLAGADLYLANPSGAYVDRAVFNAAKTGHTVFGDLDLSMAKGLATIVHEGPSTVGIDTLYRSRGRIPVEFLRGAGVPQPLVEYASSLVRRRVPYYSCFLSHSHRDKSFCERLRTDLQTHGVRVWYFPEDAAVGRSVWSEIDRSLAIYDKLVVACSKHSLQSGPVLREIQRALQREDREGSYVLFPIRLDDYLFEDWDHERKADVVSKVMGDFSGWDKDAEKYREAFEKLMRALETEGLTEAE